MSDWAQFSRTREHLERGLAQGHHLGAQLYISRRGEPQLDLAWGEAQDGVPMQRDTLMVWLSASKPLAAIALAQLLPKHGFTFDSRVAEIWPEFAQAGKESVTLRHLLTHTAGLRAGDSMWNKLGWEENLQLAAAAPLDAEWPLGKKAAYHLSVTWFVLGEIVRRLDGRSYADYVRAEIFLPLGLKDCWLATDEATYQAYGQQIGLMHNTAQGRREPHSFWDSLLGYTLCRPGSSAHGPIRSLARIYECLLAGGAPLLGGEAVQELTRRHRVGVYDETFQHTIDWGLGFIVNSARYGRETVPYGYGLHASESTYGHSGAQSSAAFADPENQVVVAWVLNGMCGEPLHRSRARGLNTAIYEDLGLTRH